MGERKSLEGLSREELLKLLKQAREDFQTAENRREEGNMKSQEAVDVEGDYNYNRRLIQDIEDKLEEDKKKKM